MQRCVKCYILCVFFSFAVCSCVRHYSMVSSPAVIAHRGAAYSGPENSLLGIERAIRCGVDAVEVDVRSTCCGNIVLMHDATVDRTTDGSGRVADLSLCEIKQLRLLDEGGAVTGERVPTLDETLAVIDGRCRVLIEVKGRAVGVERAVVDAIVRADAFSWVSVQSFSDDVLRCFASLGAPLVLEKLFVFKIPLLPVIFDNSFSFFSMRRYEHVSSFNIDKRFLTRNLVKALKREGKGVKAWTFGKGECVFSVPVDGVITDSPFLWR